MKSIYILLLLLIPVCCLAQEKEKVLYGKVMVSHSFELVKNATVKNTRTHIITHSDSSGNFSIPTIYDDTLLVISHPYKDRRFTVSQGAEIRDDRICIYMIDDTIYLNTVIINAKPYVQFTKDIHTPKPQPLPGIFPHKGPLSDNSPGIMNPISLLSSHFSTSARLERMLESARAIRRDKEIQRQARLRYDSLYRKEKSGRDSLFKE